MPQSHRTGVARVTRVIWVFAVCSLQLISVFAYFHGELGKQTRRGSQVVSLERCVPWPRHGLGSVVMVDTVGS